jgi:hypothetical protein
VTAGGVDVVVWMELPHPATASAAIPESVIARVSRRTR